MIAKNTLDSPETQLNFEAGLFIFAMFRLIIMFLIVFDKKQMERGYSFSTRYVKCSYFLYTIRKEVNAA
ncbi:hypothetical protein SAMN06295926_104117 [Lysinibacillus sp. AC-3]|nr:hypothetical protein SAMN06295926_104117 [Lysinibacillus sp. AC-3]